jgi:hypothetical protein
LVVAPRSVLADHPSPYDASLAHQASVSVLRDRCNLPAREALGPACGLLHSEQQQCSGWRQNLPPIEFEVLSRVGMHLKYLS